MKTKQVRPWNLKPGQSLMLETFPRSVTHPTGNPAPRKIQSISKERGTFTGATIWRVKVECPFSPLGYEIVNYHGKGRGLFADKALVVA